MADSNRVIQATLSKYSKNKLERAYTEELTLLRITKTQNRVTGNSGGLDWRWKIKTARNPNFEDFGKADKVTFASTDNIVEAQLEYGSYRSNDFLYRKEELQNRDSDAQIFNLMRQKLDDLVDDFKQDMNIQFWRGDGTGDNIVGIETALPNTNFTSKSYAGIAFTGNAYWQNTQLDGDGGSGSAFAADALERIETGKLAASHGGAQGTPDFAITTKAVFTIVSDLITTNERYRAMTNRKAGGTALEVHDLSFDHDEEATADVLYLMNSRKMQVRWMTSGPWEVKTERSISPNGTAMHIESYPVIIIDEPRYFTTIHNAS